VRSNRDAVGARLELKAGGKTLVRQIIGGGSYLSHSSRIAHFPLPNAASPDSLTVYWPSGTIQTVEGSSLQTFMTLVEPVAE
jgi:enediyne biosynthesis protein E4